MGRRVDESSPLVDARLPDGSRVNAAIPPVAVDGPLLSIRRFGTRTAAGRRPGQEAGADRRHAGTAEGLRARAPQHRDLGRHRRRQDHSAQRALQLHSGKRAHRHHRRRGRTAPAPDARGAHGNASRQHRRQRRDQDPRSGDQRPPYASRPHHRRRGPQRRSAGHAAGHEHGPRRLAHHHPLQYAARRAWRVWKCMVGMANANMGVRAIRAAGHRAPSI